MIKFCSDEWSEGDYLMLLMFCVSNYPCGGPVFLVSKCAYMYTFYRLLVTQRTWNPEYQTNYVLL